MLYISMEYHIKMDIAQTAARDGEISKHKYWYHTIKPPENRKEES